ncbi:uncharacterized protein LOC141628720 [Silene latifolia]|uniref:uncharacterized protein LOC141628720 n=1 Tax=Silene latifolia TaxID=37657 RepID=UPI003D7770F0
MMKTLAMNQVAMQKESQILQKESQALQQNSKEFQTIVLQQNRLTDSRIGNLETQVGQILNTLTSQPTQGGTLPSHTIPPPTKEQAKAVSLRNGRELVEAPKAPKKTRSLPIVHKVEDVVEDEIEVVVEHGVASTPQPVRINEPLPEYEPQAPFPSALNDTRIIDKKTSNLYDIFHNVEVKISLLDLLSRNNQRIRGKSGNGRVGRKGRNPEGSSELAPCEFAPVQEFCFLSSKLLEELPKEKPVPSIVKAPIVEMKPLPSHLKYAFLGDEETLLVIISTKLSREQEEALIRVLKQHKEAIGWTMGDIKGISPTLCMHRILLEDEAKPVRQPQRRLNPPMMDVVKKEVLKLLHVGMIYPISDSQWVSPTQVVPKKYGLTVVENHEGVLIPTRVQNGWRVCIDYRRFNAVTRKDHSRLPFMDQMLERNMPFGLCNAPGMFQRCMMSIFSDHVEDFIEVFMDDFTVHGQSFEDCLSHLNWVLQRCIDTNLVLNHEKCHFIVDEGIVLRHVVSSRGIEVDKAKVDTIRTLPYPTNVREVKPFLGHARFYRRFIKDFSKIAAPLCKLLQKDCVFIMSEECKEAFDMLKEKLISAAIIQPPNWNEPFEIMSVASNYALGAVLGQRLGREPHVIQYASTMMNEAQRNYTTTEK